MHAGFRTTMSLALIFFCPTLLLVNAGQEVSAEDQVSLAINQLHSSSGKVRKQAKRNLLSLGSVSIKPLLDLVIDIRTNPRPQFETGKEEEGAEFIARYKSSPDNQRDFDQYHRLDMSRRLNRDAIELLGQLKAEYAIPTLILLLEEEIAISPKDITYPESMALVKIGEISVPALIKALEIAEVTADDDRQVSMNCSRLAFVLGEIGDTRALPILAGVLNRNRLVFGTDYVEYAIERIMRKNGGAAPINGG